MRKVVECDVAVIGLGAAGITAALVAATHNLSTVILTRGYGATALSSGCLDVMGYLNNKMCSNPINCIKELVSSNGHHPYTITSKLGGGVTTAIRSALQFMLKFLDGLYIRPHNGDLQNLKVLTYYGSPRPTAYIQKSMRYASTDELTQFRNVVMVGIKNLGDVDPNLTATVAEKVLGLRITTTAIDLSLSTLQSQVVVSKLLSTNGKFKILLEQLMRVVRSYTADVILLPAILSSDPSEMNFQLMELEEKLKVPVSELPSPPPSVPGLRLMNKLLSILRHLNIPIYFCSSTKATVTGNRCSEVRCTLGIGEDYEIIVRAKNYVLATGDILSGGIVDEGDLLCSHYVEPVLGLRVHVPSNIYMCRGSSLFDPESCPLSEIGVEFDEYLRPYSSSGSVLENVYVAGSILSKYNYVTERSGLGVAIVTGYYAGLQASRV